MSCSYFAGIDTTMYTADGVKVYNLYIGHIPASITKSDIRDYFSKYGDIKSVKIYIKKDVSNPINRFGFVNFEDAKSAGAALWYSSSSHRICQTVIAVEYADSWHQPDSGEKKNDGSDPTDSIENDSSTSIMRLNDDCLLHVFSFLDLHRQINASYCISKTCVRFAEILKSLLRRKKCLKICDDKVSFRQLQKVLDIAGEDLQQIETCRCSIEFPERSVKSIARMCPNLRVLHFNFPPFIRNPAVFKEIGSKLHYLTKIEIPGFGIRDDSIQYLALLQNLEFIDLASNCSITGKFLDQFPKLIHLNLQRCLRVESRFFRSICEKGTLKWLNIIDCVQLSSDCYSKHLSKLKLLEELSVGSSYRKKIKELCCLENLKALAIIRPSGSAFRNIVRNYSEQLESLTLIGDCLSEGELKLIYQLKNLKKLCFVKLFSLCDSIIERLCVLKQLNHLALVHCRNFTPDALIILFQQPSQIKELDITEYKVYKRLEDYRLAVIAISESIKSRGETSPCVIYARRDISEDLLKDEKYMEYAPFVTLCFKDFDWPRYTEFLDDDSDSEARYNNYYYTY